jgi:hypothetical protein
MASSDPVIEDTANISRTETVRSSVEKQRLGRRIGADHVVASVAHPKAKRFDAALMEWHDALFSTLAHHSQQTIDKIDTFDVQSAQLRDTKSGSVEDFTDRAVK